MDKVAELIKAGKIKEISDMRDETDLSGLKLAIDLKRGTDPDKLMQKLFRLTPLMDSFSCNFNVLIEGNPKVMGVREILENWCGWRMECVRRRVFFDLNRKKEKLHLLLGLEKILLDIDKAIAIIRGTELESEVVPNLMIGFGIDSLQAEYVAEIKLRNINREYIMKRIADREDLESAIKDLEDTLKNRRRIKSIIVSELKAIIKKYPCPRRTGIVYADEVELFDEAEAVEDYHVTVFMSNEGYLKKITPLSLRMSGEQKFKEGDGLRTSFEATNRTELLVFTDRQQVYKTRLSDFEDGKASALGAYLPSKLEMDEGERVLKLILPGDYRQNLLLFYENGKVARLELAAYETKTNRKKLINAYSDNSPLVDTMLLGEETDIVMFSDDGRALVFNSSLLQTKTSRSTQGVAAMSIKNKHRLISAAALSDTAIVNKSRYRVRSIPGAGALLKEEDRGETQLSLME